MDKANMSAANTKWYTNDHLEEDTEEDFYIDW